MKNRQTKLIIGVLAGLVLFASSLALLMYSKQSELASKVSQNVKVYVAKQSLERGHYITADDITLASLPKEFLDFSPPKPTEIVGKYVQEKLYKKEPIRLNKIASRKPKEEKIAVVVPHSKAAPLQDKENVSKSDKLSVPTTLFRNLDETIVAGNYIDIVSVVPKKDKNGKVTNFSTKYIAIHIKVLYYLSDGIQTKSLLQKSTDADTQTSVRKAQSVVLDMQPQNIKNLLKMYYTTQELNNNRVYNTNNYQGQLWMVHASKTPDKKIQKIKEQMLVDKKRHSYKKTQSVKISYEN
jgi:Flp pilus assembly protein CpaB